MARQTHKGQQIVRNRRKPRERRRPLPPYNQHTPSRANVGLLTESTSGLPLVRTSERGTFKRCRWKWRLEFYETVKPMVDVPPLRFGTLVHGALAEFYRPGIRRGPKPAITFEKLYDTELKSTPGYKAPELDEAWSEHRDLGYDMMDAYWKKYGKDDQYRVIATEFPFRTVINHPVRNTPWFWYVGIVDGVWEDRTTGKILIPDHKTTKSIQITYLRMDDQSTSYWTFGSDALMRAGIIAPDGSQPIDGILFNFLRKARQDTRPTNENGEALNKNGTVSKQRRAPLHARVPVYRDWYEREGAKLRVLAEFKDMEEVMRDSKADPESTPPSAYKNATQMNCNGCWALDICELHEIGQDWREMIEMSTRPWEPYAPHEILEDR